MRFNENLNKLQNSNSFYAATNRINEYKKNNPNNNVLSLGIGDVSLPVSSYIASKMIEAIKKETTSDYVGYGNYYGIPELRKAIRDNEYPNFSIDEIYVSDGTKTDSGNILELFDANILIGIPTPTYPIYVNSCISLNRKFEFIKCDENFVPIIPNKHFDVIYLCSPNNPVGISYSYDQLKKLIDYANKEKCVIIYDNVYYRFISNEIKSIYEVEGAKTCAIEMRSFSKHLSFTGIRCSYYVMPNELHHNVNLLWRLRTINRFNGASYIAQIGALASFDDEAKKDIQIKINYYKNNASKLKTAFVDLGYEVCGGIDAPYMWIKCKNNMKSWDVFESFLTNLEVVVVPGIIFGIEGDNYFRVSALGKTEDIDSAIERIKKYEQKI